MKSIFLKLKLIFLGFDVDRLRSYLAHLLFINMTVCLLFFISLVNPQISSAQSNAVHNTAEQEVTGYKTPKTSDSEFDNPHDEFAVYWRDANEVYEDTVFGELIYGEPSTATKLEMLRLLSKDTPSLTVFMHAVSMGLSIDEVLLAALEYEPDRARDLAGSAISLLPLLGDADTYRYSTYNLDGLERYVDGTIEDRDKGYVESGNEHKPYSVQEVADKFFKNRLVLAPYPDWFDGQIHFMASAKELSDFQQKSSQKRWYHSKNRNKPNSRPIFISLYENDKTILVDDPERIRRALQKNPEAQLPVVFIYNRIRERSIDSLVDLGYPATLHGLRDAYIKQSLMVTPTPEWQTGEYHIYVEIDEFYKFFDVPEESDFEPQAWEELLNEARKYDVASTSFLVIMLRSQNKRKNKKDEESAQNLLFSSGSMFAAWDNPRTESQFKYTSPQSATALNLDSLVGRGLVLNRPDLLAALKALGVSSVPVSVYYLDSARVKPYLRGPRSLIQAALGADAPTVVPPGGGFLPPPSDLPPASPPGLP